MRSWEGGVARIPGTAFGFGRLEASFYFIIEALDSNCDRDFSLMIAWMAQRLSAMANSASTESMLVVMRGTCAKSPIAWSSVMAVKL